MMKILIPYDGSKNADIALDYLQASAEFAARGQKQEILVVVTDVWLPESTKEFFSTLAVRKQQTGISGISSHTPARRKLEEEQALARKLRQQLELKFPPESVRVGTLPGFSLVSSEILKIAENWGADIIIIGLQGEDVPPAALRIATEARCSVRFARAVNSKYGRCVTDSISLAARKQLEKQESLTHKLLNKG